MYHSPILFQIILSNKLVSSTNSFTKDIFDNFTKHILSIKNNIELFNNLNEKLESLKSEIDEKKIKNMIDEYNNLYSNSVNKIFSSNLEIKNFIKSQPVNDEIINEEYTLPLVYYKHIALCRFKEAMNLALHIEKLSYLKALSLAIECLTNYNLHPAIITACKSIDELDIYLSCLEDNQLDDFKIFDIKYEMLPKVSKPQSKLIFENT